MTTVDRCHAWVTPPLAFCSRQRASMLRYVLKQMIASPLQFLFPVQPKQPAAVDSKKDIERPAPAA